MALPQAYLYLPLDPARNETRIVVLQPGDWSSEVEVSLQIISLDEDPQYKAVSYVWGDAGHTHQ